MLTALSQNEGMFLNQTPSQFFERRVATLYGINSMVIKALDLVKKEMCTEKGFKRDDGQDYYNHCIDVANNLISFCVKDEDTICAALLHDIIEDVKGYSEELISNMFNPRVAELVMLVTKKKGLDYKDAGVINEYLRTMADDMYASTIKTSDRMHNMMTLQEKTFDARYSKCIETETYYLSFFKLCRQKYPRFENLFYAARTQIEPIIFEVKSFYFEIKRLREELEKKDIVISDLKGEN